jgi:AraC-like DNA-binding protein
VIILVFNFKTHDFQLEYTESEVKCPVLWESHCHSQYEMIAVADGDITVTLEGQIYVLKENQVIIIPPLCYHSVTANEKGSYRRITALLGIDVIPEPLRAEFVGQDKNAKIATFDVDRLKLLCEKENTEFYAPLVYSLMVQIFYDAITQKQSAVKIKADEFLQKALLYIDKHLNEKILLDDLARYTAHSKSSFCHLFEQKMNISPKQYIIQKKLAVASKLISEGVPHTVAAMQVGYENYSNFYRLNKKVLKK